MLRQIGRAYNLVDELILTQYTRMAHRHEHKTGENKYELASRIFDKSTDTMLVSGAMYFHKEAIATPVIWFLSISPAFNRRICQDLEINEQKELETDTLDKMTEDIRTYDMLTRLPLSLLSVFAMGGGAYESLQHADDPIGMLLTGGPRVALGLAIFFYSAGQYVRSSDPKLLEKTPVHKRVREWVSSKLPRPSPEPEPVAVGASMQETPALEEILEAA